MDLPKQGRGQKKNCNCDNGVAKIGEDKKKRVILDGFVEIGERKKRKKKNCYCVKGVAKIEKIKKK